MARDSVRIAVVWLVWLGALLATVGIGLGAGSYHHHLGWYEHQGLWPLFSWDYNWYELIARSGYPAHVGGRQYAFFQLWPLLLRWAGTH